MSKFKPTKNGLIMMAILVGSFFVISFFLPDFLSVKYDSKLAKANTADALASTSASNNAASASLNASGTISSTTAPIVTHIKTPKQVKGIYMTSWVAGMPVLRESVIKIAEKTEVNTILIDIKDYTGDIAFSVNDPTLKAYGADDHRIRDLDTLIAELHSKGIYVIGRVAAFQDPHMVATHPELAVKRASDGKIWKDRKGISWIDAGAKPQWDYLVQIGKEAYARGFDEINYDYIRFPSDGNMKDISYPFSENKQKHLVIKDFFAYVAQNLKPTGAIVSADLFGMTTTNKDDLGIGQIIEDALVSFDYVCPMVYPSHYPATWNGFKNPADHPYDVIKISMTGAIDKLNTLKNATSTPADVKAHLSINQLRPWLQDFNLGATYTSTEVRAQIKATYDIGLNSWLIWSPSNKYSPGSFDSN